MQRAKPFINNPPRRVLDHPEKLKPPKLEQQKETQADIVETRGFSFFQLQALT